MLARFTRSELLSASDLVDEASMDRYVFLRDGYLQRRRFLIYDGNPPREYDPDDPDLPDPAGGIASTGIALT